MLSVDLEGVISTQDDDDTPFFQIFPLDGLRATRGFAGGDVKSDHFSILYLSPAGRCQGTFFTDGRNIVVNGVSSLCLKCQESCSHIFFECDYSFAVISELIRGLKNHILRPNIFQNFELITDMIVQWLIIRTSTAFFLVALSKMCGGREMRETLDPIIKVGSLHQQMHES
ncbi:hypothetical protein M5K25_009817 [Dendrobium thyrsiflorum]|uniref:Reverse transcriptase zinc-binding domain-containing protein n=1 Tax=Dendrobium thyrsiflorum TaxID=117978 RepID=A0ABD0V6R0_DENTH